MAEGLSRARELRQKRAKLVKEAQNIWADAGDEITAEVKERFDVRMDEVKELREKITEIEDREARIKEEVEAIERRQSEERHEQGENRVNTMAADERAQLERTAFIKAVTGRALNDDERAVVRRTQQQYPDAHEVRAGQQTVGTSGSGGVLVPEGFMAEIMQATKAYGGMRRVARIVNTNTGNDVPWPASDDTANQAVIVGEATTGAGSTHVPFRNVTLKAWKYKSGPIKYSVEFEQDAFMAVEPYLRGRIAERFGRGTESDFASTKAGTSTPQGIFNAVDTAVTIATGSSNLTPEKLKDLRHSIDPSYRPGSAYMSHDDVYQEVAKIRWGSSGPFILQPSATQGDPERLFGHPYIVNNSFAQNLLSSTQTEATAGLLFGNFRNYIVRDVRAMTVFPIRERYINEGNLAIYAFSRHDGRAVFGSTVTTLRPIRALGTTT